MTDETTTTASLHQFMLAHGPQKRLKCSDGALANANHYPLAALETTGAVLFADMPGYSSRAVELTPVECAALTSLFFAWFEGEALRGSNGLLDKYIGDEAMVVFLDDHGPALVRAMQVAERMLAHDPYAFAPKIGIAHGQLAVAWVGTYATPRVTAIGSTVNLAARCVGGLGAGQVRIATSEHQAVAEVFSDMPWQVGPVEPFEPKNMPTTEVINVERQAVWVPTFDIMSNLRDWIAMARESGAIIGPLPESQRGGA